MTIPKDCQRLAEVDGDPQGDRGELMSRPAQHDVGRVLRDGDAIDRAIVAARRRVILRHRQLNVPLAIWRDGRVVEVRPESVELPSNGDDTGARTGES